MPDLFEDVETRDTAPPQPADVAAQRGLVDRARWSWETKSRGGKILIVVLLGFGILALYGAVAGGGGDEATSTSSTTAAKTDTTTAPTTTQPPRKLVPAAKSRPVGDPLRGLPDIHHMVYAYAGADADSFSNVIRTLIGAGASMCDLFFGVDPAGWRVVPRTPDVAYPNDYFPARVFTSPPCPAPVGDPDPQNFIKPATPTTAGA